MTAVGVRGRTETLPFLGQAVLVGPQRSPAGPARRRRDGRDSQGAGSYCTTPPSGSRQCSSATARSGAEQWRRTAETAGTATPAQPSRGRRDCDGSRGTTVRGRTETLPFLGQAVLVSDHPQWSGAAAAEERRRLQGSGPSAARRARPEGEETAATVRVRDRTVPRCHTPSGGRPCSSATASSGAERSAAHVKTPAELETDLRPVLARDKLERALCSQFHRLSSQLRGRCRLCPALLRSKAWRLLGHDPPGHECVSGSKSSELLKIETEGVSQALVLSG